MLTLTLESVFLPVGRVRALSRALLSSAPAFLLGVLTVAMYNRLDFVPSGVSNRLVEISVAVCLLPVAATSLYTAFGALRWFALAIWPGRLDIEANGSTLAFHLGPFGSHRYDAAHLDARYPFELTGDLDEGSVEAFLPEEEQKASLLPRMMHTESRALLNRTILRFTSMGEEQAAQALRGVIEQWQRTNP